MTTKKINGLKFTVHDVRGQRGFPSSDKGFLYEHLEKRSVYCRYTGQEIKRLARYCIRVDSSSDYWRIDRLPVIGPTEGVYGVDGTAYWDTVIGAVEALANLLDEIKTNSSLSRL